MRVSITLQVDSVKFQLDTRQNLAASSVVLTQNTILTINKLPATTEEIKFRISSDNDSLQNSFSKFKESSIEFGILVWKILLLEATEEMCGTAR